MDIFLKLYGSLLPYLLCIPLGYWIQKKSFFSKPWFTFPLIYIMMPLMVIRHFLEADAVKLAILPAMSFTLSLAMIVPAIIAHKKFAGSYNINLLKSSFSFFNIAFFGIPIVSALYGEEGITVLICIFIGSALYGDIIGYYQMARSKYTVKEAFLKILKVPFIYAFIVAVILKLSRVEMPEDLMPVTDLFSVLVSVAGMMIIGSNLTKLKIKGVDWGFLGKLTLLRTVSAILIMGLLLLLEYWLLDRVESVDREMLGLIALFPIAANVTVYASFFGSEEENSALLVGITLLLSLVLVPLLAFTFQWF